jgi:DNA-binding NtrC family response regulator
MTGQEILVFETDSAWRAAVGWTLQDRAVRVTPAFELANLRRSFESCSAIVVILAPSALDSPRALELAKRIRQLSRHVSLLFVTSSSTEDLAIAALRAGITEYLKHPFSASQFDDAVQHCLLLARGPDKSPDLAESGPMIGESPLIRQVKDYIGKVGATNSNVLITGETGTGKELAAELVHRCSNRREKPFLTINSAAIPDALVESELFGYDRGAFTGAECTNEGKLVAANGGSIFLDEIADLSAYAQAKILRVIENKEIYRLGSKRGIAIDVRFIAATNQCLEDLVTQGKFRKDLFFRLNVTRVHLPPLRERKDDLPFLLDHFIQALNRRLGLHVRRLTEEALEHLFAYDWPGNVRELKNLLEAIFVDRPLSEISLESLPLHFRMRCERSKSVPCSERDELLHALLVTRWNKSKAAEKLRWSRMTLYRKMARYRIVRKPGNAGLRPPVPTGGQSDQTRVVSDPLLNCGAAH